MALNKQDVVNQITAKTDFTKKDVNTFVDEFLATIVDGTRKEGEVKFIGFGKFFVADRAARKGRNPQTGKEMQIPAHKTIRFSAGNKFKNQIK